MTKRMYHQLELMGETATLYVTGSLSDEHADALIEICAEIPKYARMLRLDLHGLGQLSAEAIGVVRTLLHFWRHSRQGEFRLTTSYMVATLREVHHARVPAPPLAHVHRVNEALAGTVSAIPA
jgi:ABC-type transporter Mla MlaB component